MKVPLAEERTEVFIDASVLVAAAGSASGGSSLALEVCRGRMYRAVATRRVLLEAERNIRTKLHRDALLRFYRQIAALEPEILSPPSQEETERFTAIIARKDAPVLAAAVIGKTSFLLTLDRRDFMSSGVRQAQLPVAILTPGEFLAMFRREAEGR